MSKRNVIILFILSITILILVPTAFAREMRQDKDFDPIDAYIERELARWNLPGVALAIVQDGHVVYMQGYGDAGPDGRPMTPQMPMIVASLSKSFTALAIMQLAENGPVDLDESVQTYLPWFHVADEEASAQITVRHLLNQNSGIAGTSGLDTIFSDDQGDEALANAVRRLSDDELLYPVGETYEYSNANFHTLGAIVEAVSGMTYAQYIKENIFGPLEMTNCFTSRDDALLNGLSSGYGRWWLEIPLDISAPYNPGNLPAGGLICDAEGMAHYMIAYLSEGQYGNETILSPEGIAQMHTPAVPTGEDNDSYYAMGWIIGQVNDVEAVYHSGDAPTYQTAVLMVPEEELGIVLLTNTNNITILYSTRAMAADVMNILHGEQATGFEQDSFIRMVYWTVLGPLALAILWEAWSILRWLRRRKQGKASPQGFRSVMWVIFLPLIVDGFFIFYYLVLTPILWGFPLKAFPIMYPNVWTVMVAGAFLGGAAMVARLVAFLGGRLGKPDTLSPRLQTTGE